MTDDERDALIDALAPLVGEFVEAIGLDFRYTERMAQDASTRRAMIARVEETRERRREQSREYKRARSAQAALVSR